MEGDEYLGEGADISIEEESAPGRLSRSGRDKGAFKTRGSIASQLEAEQVVIPSHRRVNDSKARINAIAKEKKRKSKAIKKINLDVFIPSTVSVGQLARLLNVRMGD